MFKSSELKRNSSKTVTYIIKFWRIRDFYQIFHPQKTSIFDEFLYTSLSCKEILNFFNSKICLNKWNQIFPKKKLLSQKGFFWERGRLKTKALDEFLKDGGYFLQLTSLFAFFLWVKKWDFDSKEKLYEFGENICLDTRNNLDFSTKRELFLETINIFPSS